MSSKTFYSPGKLMICGEYAVLNGATAFALPTKKGQHLTVTTGDTNISPILYWTAKDQAGKPWFEAQITLPNLLLLESTNAIIAIQLLRFLINAKTINNSFLTSECDIYVETILEFGLDEGLGSSSTLTCNLAKWAQINPYQLHFSSFKGSGFDVAIAAEEKALLYTMNGINPIIETLTWQITFREKLFFVHLNKKQNSQEQVYNYKNNYNPALLAQISRISRLISVNLDYFEFCLLLELAENEMSKILGMPSIKQSLFSDFKGTIKSLGAWGGDYILATGEDVNKYFKSKGYSRIVSFKDMIK